MNCFELLPEVSFKCGKMDTFAVSVPRLFISFHLDNETNGQLAQESAEAMDTTPVHMPNTEQQSSSSDFEIEVVEITSSPERADTPRTPLQEEIPEREPNPPTNLLPAQICKKGGFAFTSSGSHENCTTYLTKKIEALEAMKIEPPDAPSQATEKQSVSERIELRPVVSSPTTPTATSSHSPTKHVLNSPHLTLQSSLEGACQLGEKRRQGVSISDAPIHFEFAPAREHQSLSEANDSSRNDTQ